MVMFIIKNSKNLVDYTIRSHRQDDVSLSNTEVMNIVQHFSCFHIRSAGQIVSEITYNVSSGTLIR